MRVLKFGSSSLATAERILGVVPIVARASREGEVAVVVSALGGVTDALLAAADVARRGGEWAEGADAVADRLRG